MFRLHEGEESSGMETDIVIEVHEHILPPLSTKKPGSNNYKQQLQSSGVLSEPKLSLHDVLAHFRLIAFLSASFLLHLHENACVTVIALPPHPQLAKLHWRPIGLASSLALVLPRIKETTGGLTTKRTCCLTLLMDYKIAKVTENVD